jgi:hypothetical protein
MLPLDSYDQIFPFHVPRWQIPFTSIKVVRFPFYISATNGNVSIITSNTYICAVNPPQRHHLVLSQKCLYHTFQPLLRDHLHTCPRRGRFLSGVGTACSDAKYSCWFLCCRFPRLLPCNRLCTAQIMTHIRKYRFHIVLYDTRSRSAQK